MTAIYVTPTCIKGLLKKKKNSYKKEHIENVSTNKGPNQRSCQRRQQVGAYDCIICVRLLKLAIESSNGISTKIIINNKTFF